MKVEISSFDMNRALKNLSKIKGITQMSVVGDIVTLERSNANTAIKTIFHGYSWDNGETIFSEETVELFKKLNDDLTVTEDLIVSGNRVIKYYGQATPYMHKPAETYNLAFITTGKELHKMLQVKYAMAIDETRPILCGVYFRNDETCALDGYRMSVRKGTYISETKFVLNKNTVDILDSLLESKLDKPVEVYYEPQLERAKFVIDSDIQITGRTLIGEFINYKQIIPDYHQQLVKVNPDSLKKELDFIGSLHTEILRLNFIDNKLIMITSQCKKELDEEAGKTRTRELRVKAHGDYKENYDKWVAKKAKAKKAGKEFKTKPPEEKTIRPQKAYKLVPISDIKIEVGCRTELEGDKEFKIAVNSRYLIEAIKQYSDECELRMASGVSPIVITDDGENLELVLPVRIPEEI